MTAETIDAASENVERSRDNQAWARWLARGADALILTPFVLLTFFALGVAIELRRAPAVILTWLDNPVLAGAIHLGVMFVLFSLWEPLFLSNAGATPGKWIMGIRVRRTNRDLVSFPRAFGRFFQVWFVGMGAGIPVLSLILMLMAQSKLVSEGVMGWDKNLDCRVEHRQRHPIVWFLVIVIVLGANIAFRVLEQMDN